ncbi:MAG: hypothetical protein IJ279_04485 [Clostridia bacterium]|nr:hypothetical protein [Clostridia bacterium]
MGKTLKQVWGFIACRVYFLGEILKRKEIGVVSASTSKIIKKNDPVHITAHRGFSGVAPENTLPAFEKACKEAYYAIECDVHLTKDGEWIVCHNSTIDKTCNGEGNISDYTLEELRNFKVTYGHGIEKYPDLKLPTLDEYLDLCQKYNKVPEIEIKRDGYYDTKLTDIIEKLKERNLLDKAIIISFDINKLIKLQEYSPDTEYWYLVETIDNAGIENAKKYGFAYAVCASNKNSDFKKAVKAGLKVCVWTVDRLSKMESLYNLGIRYITSNFITP